MRDSHYVGTKNNFDCMRYFQTTKIIPVDEQLQICVRDKEFINLYQLFHTRWLLHHRVYQHKTTKIVEVMLSEALQLVDERFEIFASRKSPEKYTHLTDSIINEICRSTSNEKDVKEAKKIINRIQTRQLYKFCGLVNLPTEDVFQKNDLDIAKEIAKEESETINSNDLIVQKVEISFGMKDKDPIESVIFFNKDDEPKKIKQDHISHLLPKKFEERFIRVYCRDPSKRDAVGKALESWCKINHLDIPSCLYGSRGAYFTDVHKSETAKKAKMDDREKSRKDNSNTKRGLLP